MINRPLIIVKHHKAIEVQSFERQFYYDPFLIISDDYCQGNKQTAPYWNYYRLEASACENHLLTVSQVWIFCKQFDKKRESQYYQCRKVFRRPQVFIMWIPKIPHDDWHIKLKWYKTSHYFCTNIFPYFLRWECL